MKVTPKIIEKIHLVYDYDFQYVLRSKENFQETKCQIFDLRVKNSSRQKEYNA